VETSDQELLGAGVGFQKFKEEEEAKAPLMRLASSVL
jgi:hypothetical protein